MRALGVEGVRVDRPTVRLIGDWLGVRLASDDVSPEQWRELMRATSDSTRRTAAEAFDGDPRDTSTPEGTTLLLTKIWRGEALSPQSTTLLLDILRRVSTGAERLKGMLPRDRGLREGVEERDPDPRARHRTDRPRDVRLLPLQSGENVRPASDCGIRTTSSWEACSASKPR
jgi:hypothetical protein